MYDIGPTQRYSSSENNEYLGCEAGFVHHRSIIMSNFYSRFHVKSLNMLFVRAI